MRLKLEVDFWFDGMEDCNEEEIKDYLVGLLDSGAEATCSEITLVKVSE